MDVGFILNWKRWGEELEAAYEEFRAVGSSLSLYSAFLADGGQMVLD